MCHEFYGRAWDDRTIDADQEQEEEKVEETPSFMSDEPAEDVELLTDGGDE